MLKPQDVLVLLHLVVRDRPGFGGVEAGVGNR